MSTRRYELLALLGFAVLTGLAGWAPWAPLRIVALVLFLATFPLGAAALLQRRAFGRRTMLDLQVGAALALLMLLLLAVGAFFVGLQLPLHRGPMVLALGVLAVAVFVAARLLPQGPADPVDESPAAPRGRGASPAWWRSPGRLAAAGVTVVCLAAAVIVSVVSQHHFDDRSRTTALGIRQTANVGGRRTYVIDIQSQHMPTQQLVLVLTVEGQAARRTALTLHEGQQVSRTLTAPATSSVAAALARAATPAKTYRSVHIGH